MEPSQAQRENPARGEENVESTSLSRFRRLATQLFGVDQDAFREAQRKDEVERREKRRARSRDAAKIDVGGEPSDQKS